MQNYLHAQASRDLKCTVLKLSYFMHSLNFSGLRVQKMYPRRHVPSSISTSLKKTIRVNKYISVVKLV